MPARGIPHVLFEIEEGALVLIYICGGKKIDCSGSKVLAIVFTPIFYRSLSS